ncbi:hypothetical protein CC86DRAFT_375340 [Ophiobolus disseminans]|uniref:Uncharacterized protein n=1 Tax=Ophiobolus disseminans TaxID=1469910 RepID=A0A6A6ZFY7_9PLEO|nr:hypothetical protein CC86DRAFT_375340 [Ophiobolus disseminans]
MHSPVMSRNAPAHLELQHPPQASRGSHYSPRGDVRAHQHSRKQSTQSFAEENFDNVDITDHIRPPPFAITHSATAYDPHSDAPSPLEDFPHSASSGHQRTLTGTLFDNSQSLLNRASSTLQQHTSRASFHSPTKSLASFIPSRGTPESNASQPKIRAIQNWFNGASAPVKLGVAQQTEESDSESESGEEYSSEEESDEEEEERGNMMSNIFNRGQSLTRSATQSPTRNESPRRFEETPTPTKSKQPTAGSKFAWLLSTQKNAVIPPPLSSPTYHDPEDELLNLNIAQSLFPHGPADPLAPSSFNDLLANAEALLSRYQRSYRQLSTKFVDARSEQSAQEDELDEADTRARHLKMQLETMAARANEQDEQMRKLVEELAVERRARQDEEAARKRSLALVRTQPVCEHVECQDTPRRRNRISGSEVSVDSGFESECETDAASVFSRNCLSPTGTDMSSIHETEVDSTPKNRKPQPLQRRSTYDKVRDGTVNLEKGGWGCANCEGGAQAGVWGRLAKEREENRTLRHRVEHLEEAVESALNVVDGPWGM